MTNGIMSRCLVGIAFAVRKRYKSFIDVSSISTIITSQLYNIQTVFLPSFLPLKPNTLFQLFASYTSSNMQYTIIIASLLAAAVSAAPVSPAVTPAVRATPFDAPVTPAVARPIARRGQQPINDCGDSSFNNQSSGGSPRIDDCKQIIADLKAIGPHTFVSYPLTHHILALVHTY